MPNHEIYPSTVQPRDQSMNPFKMPEDINHQRRRFLSKAAMTITAAQFGALNPAKAEATSDAAREIRSVQPGTKKSFSSMSQSGAGLLNVGYGEADPTEGPAVILLHGWPYDIHSFVDVAPLLASAGY